MKNKHQLILSSLDDPLARQLLEHDDRPWYIPGETRAYLIALSEGYCAICKRKARRLHIDHKQPVSRGGTCVLDNLQVLCQFCNCSKSDHLLDPRSYELGYPIPIYEQTDRTITRLIMEKLEDTYA